MNVFYSRSEATDIIMLSWKLPIILFFPPLVPLQPHLNNSTWSLLFVFVIVVYMEEGVQSRVGTSGTL